MIFQIKQLPSLSFLFLILVFGSEYSQAQKFTNSPYSRFGVGELASQGTARNKAMGGTGIALRDGFFLNSLNPASYTTLDSTTFIFDLGVSGIFTQLKSMEATQSKKQANFEYFSLGFSAKKWWGISLGVRKVTNVGYNLSFNFKDEKKGNYTSKYVGSGGINKVYLGNAFRINQKLSVGFNANYNWGKITNTKEVKFLGNTGFPFQSNEELTISNLNFDFGVQYTGKFNEKNDFTLGATFGNKTDLTGKYKALLYRLNTSDVISYTEKDKNTIELPNRLGIGLAVRNNNKLILAADAHYQAWGDVASINVGNTEVPVHLKNSYGLALGVEYTPNRFSGRKFFDRLSYRGGISYNNSNLEIKGTQIREFGLTAGLGVPVRSSYINIALELGTRGTTENDLINEKFARISLSFTLFEAWFQKILYD